MTAVHGGPRTNATDSLNRSLLRVVALAESGLFDHYVVYENRGNWVFAGGVVGSVVMTGAMVRTTFVGTEPRVFEWSGEPAAAVHDALASLPVAAWNAWGWVGFDFATYVHGVGDPARADTTLVHLVVPEIEVTFGDDLGDDVVVTGGSAAGRAAVQELLWPIAPAAVHSCEQVDVGADTDRFRERAATAIAEIRRGEYAKVILSRTVSIPFDVDLPQTYRAGRLANTPARSFLLKTGELSAAGFSPELVVSVDRDRMVRAEPLAGTRAFGFGPELDSAARTDLEGDPKEIAEHAVSVRTAFREVESVARPGTTTVSDFMSVRERGSVQHLASTVRGRLRDDLSPWDAFAAVFPAVTASGIPKPEAVDAITRLDHDPRGLYSGAVVRVSSDGCLEAALVLRAVYQQNGLAWLRAGAGLVAQSTPEREFDETCEKLASVAPHLVGAFGPCAR